MQVKTVIKLLIDSYDLDDELMIDWVDKHQFDEFSNGAWHHLEREDWLKAVDAMEQSSEGMIDMDYVGRTVNETKNEEARKPLEERILRGT